jgi:ribosome-associated protein
MEPVDGHHLTPKGRRIKAEAVGWFASRSGGPGGQHANTSDTAVTVTIEVALTGLPDTVRQRVLDAAGPVVSATCARTRSQWRNRQLAWQEAFERLDAAASPPPAPRARTRPSRGAREERLAEKRRSSERKRERQRPRGDD